MKPGLEVEGRYDTEIAEGTEKKRLCSRGSYSTGKRETVGDYFREQVKDIVNILFDDEIPITVSDAEGPFKSKLGQGVYAPEFR